MAQDIKFGNKSSADELCDRMLGALTLPSMREPVMAYEVVARYVAYSSDSAHEYPCLLMAIEELYSRILSPLEANVHMGWHLSDTGLRSAGVGCLEDLVELNHEEFWAEHVNFFELPTRTELGRILRSISGGEDAVSDSTLRGWASRWTKKHSIGTNFILQNGVLATPELADKLSRVSFQQWIKAQ